MIYGAGEAAYHQDIIDMEEAFSALTRIKAEGGPASFSYKNYNLPARLVLVDSHPGCSAYLASYVVLQGRGYCLLPGS